MRTLFLCVGASAASARLVAQCPDGAPPPCAGAAPVRTRVIVLPFASTADSLSVAFAALLGEDVSAALSSARRIELLSARTPPTRAHFVVRGRAGRSGDLLRASASVERVATGRVVYAARLEERSAAVTLVRDSLAAGILAAVGADPAAVRRAPGLSRDPIANDLYARGRYHVGRRRQEDVAAAYRFFSQAIARDSSFARAWASLSLALDWARYYDLTIPGVSRDSMTSSSVFAIRTALRLDSSDAETWSTAGRVSFAVDPSDPGPALRALDRAIALDSAYRPAWGNRGWLLAMLDDSAGASNAWDRSGSEPLPIQAQLLSWWRSYDSAAVRAEAAVARDPTLMFARETVGDVAILRGRLDQAEAAYDAARRMASGREVVRSLSGLARVAAARGDTARARALTAQAAALPDPDHPGPDGVIAVAAAWGAIGESDSALAWLERYRPRADLHFQLHLRRDPALDPLRLLPRFRRLVLVVPRES